MLSKSVLRIENVNKYYSGVHAVKNLSMTLHSSRIYGLLGPNGAGKTSLIRMITQITNPDDGKIYFHEKALKRKDVKRIGYMPEERGLYKKMKVGDHLIYLANLRGLSDEIAKKEIFYWFDRLSIDGWWNKKVKDLSKGMQQKIQFISTVLHKPDLIILDEPFSGLDPVNANMIRREIARMVKEEGRTVIFSTHRMEQVEQICDDIALINQGEKILEGEVHHIKQDFKKGKFLFTFGNEEETHDIVLSEGITRSGPRSILLQTPNKEDALQLLRAWINAQKNIVHFEELLPSLNEIFIELVTKNSAV